jgi:hypothetical protein
LADEAERLRESAERLRQALLQAAGPPLEREGAGLVATATSPTQDAPLGLEEAAVPEEEAVGEEAVPAEAGQLIAE